MSEVLHDVCCEECGDTIRIYDSSDGPDGKVICSRCMHPHTTYFGSTNSPHWHDDASGFSGSWDNAVRAYES